MIAACPKCGARYRIERGKLRAEGTRLRCSRCEAVFRVSPPQQAEREPRDAIPVAIFDPERVRSSAGAAAGEADAERERLVLVADAEVEAGKQIASALVDAGLQPVLVHDGVEAILTIQRTLPRAVVLDAGLPKMFGFQVCELVKRNESLRQIRVVLVGAIHHRDRYRRAPSEIYGADAYLERHQLRENLIETLRDLGLPVGNVSAGRGAVRAAPASLRAPREAQLVAPAPRVRPEPERPGGIGKAAKRPRSEAQPSEVREASKAAPRPRSEAQPSGVEEFRAAHWPRSEAQPSEVEELPASDPALAAEIGRAERLARIIVSDVVLYAEDKLDAAIRAGKVLEVFESEMQEGRGHFAQRIDARVRESRDFLSEELLRVARARGMR